MIPLAPLIGAVINLVFGPWLERVFGRWIIHTIAIAAVVVAFGVSVGLIFGPLLRAFHDGHGGIGITQIAYTWIEVGSFKAQLAFRLDTLSAVMILIVTFVGSLIHIYSSGYMAHDPRYCAFFGYLNLFTGAMLILVLAANLPVMFIGWEGVGLCSYLLIGFWYENEAFATAGRKAFVVNRIGDFAFLIGMFLLFWATKDLNAGDGGSLDFAMLRSAAAAPKYVAGFWGGERLAAAAGILLFIGACGKSAQLPLFVWLPDAMAGPTPVSALIHAATMVTAGVYMVCRLSLLYASSTTALIVVSTVGLLTALAAAFMAFAQTDLKKVLAYSTVSQLGFMFVAAGTGNWTAAIFHLGTHAFFKACLFLGAGSVMHAMEHAGSDTPGDIMTMGGLRRHMPITRATFMISCLAIAGIPLFSGFFSKDEILAGAFTVHPPGWPAIYGKILWAGLLIAALGTAFYMWRLYFLVFGGEGRSDAANHTHESPGSMTLPLVVLAIGAFAGGIVGLPHFEHLHFPQWLGEWLKPSLFEEWYASGVSGSQEIEGHASDGTIGLLLTAASVIAVVGVGLAWGFYSRGPSKTVEQWTEGGAFAEIYRASKAKLWFDEFYDLTIVRPFKVIARFLLEFVDRFVVDTVAVNGSAFVIGIFGRVSRWFQNGNVQRYLVGVVIGGALVFVITDCHHKATFDYKIVGNEVQLHADPGSGILGSTARVYWDLDGDGKKDTDPANPGQLLDKRDVTFSGYDGPVTMWVEDPVTGREIKVTRTINLNEGRPSWPPPESAAPRPAGQANDPQGGK
ncbi:MAG TPA: NADH-quinone oxidoreductase subunit L [Kofleriaceae bacterium]|nr:NADH-quinone oxidoreductase subunit L [Kofleriaceae bacterium]